MKKFKVLQIVYNELMERHHRFIKYMYSTYPKYIILKYIFNDYKTIR